MSLLMKRKSVRKFTNQVVEQKKITEILKSAFQAPSAKNQQPWEFIVVDDKELLLKLSTISKGAHPLSVCDKAIVPIFKQTLKSPHFVIEDMSSCTTNILLEAVNQGLGAVWIGVYPLEDRTSLTNEILKIKEPFNAFSIIALGYEDGFKEVTKRYDESKVHHNQKIAWTTRSRNR